MRTMGGFGSGRTEYASAPSDRDCLKLDVAEFTDALNGEYDDRETIRGNYTWSRDGEQIAEIGWMLAEEPHEEIRLQYTAKRGEDDTTKQNYPIRITRTECNFGGSRPWFRCPRCRERVGMLYKTPREDVFACRECQEFGYTSSRASGNTDRTLRLRYNRIRKKLGAEPCHPNSFDARPPDRPKGMHEDTYDDLMSELRRLRRQWEEQVYMAGLRKLTGKPTLDDGWADG